MSILSDAQRAALRQELQAARYSGRSAPEIAAMLNAPSLVANPLPRSSALKPKPLSVPDLLSAIAPESLARLLALPANPEIVSRINAQDRDAVGLWSSALRAAGVLSATDDTAIRAALSATVPDPSWAPLVPSGPSVKRAMFGDSTWPLPSGETVDYLTPEAVLEAL